MDKISIYHRVNKEELKRDFNYRSEPLFRLNRAYAKMLFEVGMLTEADYKTIDAGLVASFSKVNAKNVELFNNDIHYLYESALFEEIGTEIAGKLHVGRSRNDMYFTMWRMSVRDAIIKVIDAVLEVQTVIDTQISQNFDTVIPYYTYGQPSQPGTWAHYLATVSEMFEADVTRLKAAFATVNRSPMGSAAGIGSSFPIDKARIAKLLGFDAPIENATLGNSAVDYFLETISAFAILNTTLSRVASDLCFFATTECAILDCDDSICGGSSIMPQKKNAVAPSLLRARAQNFTGYLSAAFTSAQSVTLFPSWETFEFFENFWQNVDGLIENIGLLEVTLERSKIRKDVAYERALEGFTAATSMAEILTSELQKPFTVTHHVVGGMIKTLMRENRLTVSEMTPELLADVSQKVLGEAVHRSEADIRKMLDPLESLRAKVTGGTPKPEDTQRLRESLTAHRLANREWLDSKIRAISQAYASL